MPNGGEYATETISGHKLLLCAREATCLIDKFTTESRFAPHGQASLESAELVRRLRFIAVRLPISRI